MTTEQSATPTAKFLFTIVNPGDFKPINQGGAVQYTQATMTMTQGAQGVTFDAASQTISVSEEANLEFSGAPDTSGETVVLYHAVGLSYQGAGGDVVGVKAFPTEKVTTPKINVNGKQVRLRIITTLDADPANDNFDFDLVIQRSTDGALGIIDPQIRNT